MEKRPPLTVGGARRATKESVRTRDRWYSIDAMDDQLHRFCSQLIAAVQLDDPAPAAERSRC